jgi:hypothetical protein
MNIYRPFEKVVSFWYRIIDQDLFKVFTTR